MKRQFKDLEKGFYPNKGSNRKQRREVLRNERFFGNGKNTPITVTPTSKFLRHRQIIPTAHYLFEGEWKTIGKLPHKLLLSPEKLNALPRTIVKHTIEHYIPRTNA